MIDGKRILNVAASEVQRLIGKTLQPQRSREDNSRRNPLIELKTDAVRTSNRRSVLSEHALEVVPRAGLVSQVMKRDADHPLAYEGIGRVRLALGQFRKASGQRKRVWMLTAHEVAGP